jgi:two-component system, sensor histidine kinase
MLSSELLGHALESAPDAIVIVDDDGQILFANSRVTPLFGYEPHELLRRRIEILLPDRLRGRHRMHRGNYTDNAQVRPMGINLELCALRKDRTEIPVEISLSPIQDGERTLTAAAIRDVTEQKKIQRELLHAREAADRANQAKSRFLSTASHDMRQPLQTLALLNGSLRRLVADHVAADAIVQQEHAIATMSRLLNTLLDISKLESGAIHPDPTDFTTTSLFDEMRAEFDNLAASKGLRLQIETGNLTVHSDPSLVGQILRNLLSNAIKYTQHGLIQLRARAVTLGFVQIAVVDTGIGIPAELLPFIFDEFFQVGVASNTTREGYGLGLSIVRHIVTLLDLKLEVRSEVGHGTEWNLDVPVGANAGTTQPVHAATHAASTRDTAPRILLVDDDQAVRNATAMLLRVDGCQVATAASLSEAICHVREAPGIDLLVTDYHLAAGETGVQVIAAVDEILGRRCKAILITGDTSSTVQELPADDHVHLASKPINADKFLSIVKSLLIP